MTQAIPLARILEMEKFASQAYEAVLMDAPANSNISIPLANLTGMLQFWCGYLSKDVAVEVTA